MSFKQPSLAKSDRLGKTIVAGLLFAVVITALAHGAVEPWSVMLFEIIILTLLALWTVRMIAGKRLTIAIPQIAYPVVALIVVGLIQSIAVSGSDGRRLSLSANVEATRGALAGLIFLFLALVIAFNFFASRQRFSTLARFLVTYGLALAVFALIQHYTWNGKFYWLRPNTVSTSPFGPFVNHNHYAGYIELLMLVPLGLVLARAIRSEARVLYGFVAAMIGISIMVSLSRGGMISMAAALLFVVIASRRLARNAQEHRRLRTANFTGRTLPGAVSRFQRLMAPLSRAGIVAAIGTAIVFGIFWLGPESVINRVSGGQAGQDSQGTATLSNRVWVWKDTLKMIAANPLLGVGLGAYDTAFPRYTQSDGSLRVPQAHNDYLQIIADCGFVGGLIALWFLFLLLRSIWRGINHSDPLLGGLALGCGGGIIAILVHSLIDFNLQLPANALLFLLLTAVVSRIGAAADAPEALALVRQPKAEVERGMPATLVGS